MSPPRAVVVAGSVAGRRTLANAATSAGYDVAAACPDARTALARLAQFRPGLVLVDTDIAPDGLPELRRAVPGAALVVLSDLQTAGRDESARALGAQVLAEIGELPARSGSTAGTTARVQRVGPPPARRPHTGAIEVVAIGASTGGPAALASVFKGLPAALPVPVVLTQHMPASFTKVLASRLDTTTGMRVREAAGGEHIGAGEVWIAPGDRHLTVVREGDDLVIRLNQDPPECFCRPSVDVMFRSLATSVGGACLAAVLTGMGQDGLRGATLLRDVGATVLAQDEATSVVWGMPGYVTRAGLATRVLPLEEIAGEIVSRVAVGRNSAAMTMRRELGRAS